MVGKWVSFWEGLFSGAMLVLGRVPSRSLTVGPLKSYRAPKGSRIVLQSHHFWGPELLNFRAVIHPQGQFPIQTPPKNMFGWYVLCVKTSSQFRSLESLDVKSKFLATWTCLPRMTQHIHTYSSFCRRQNRNQKSSCHNVETKFLYMLWGTSDKTLGSLTPQKLTVALG